MTRSPAAHCERKTSSAISLASARSLHHGCRYAQPQGGKQSRRGCPPANVNAGVPLNMMVHIQWNLTESKQDNFSALRNERFCRWLRTRSKQLGIKIDPYYTYVKEKNHTHWLVYIPDQLVDEFNYLLPRWITSLESKGRGARKRAENHEPAPEGTVLSEPVRNSVAARKYMLKGIERKHAFRFGIRVVEDQGVIQGRRSGVSRTLGPAARKRAGYKAKRAPWMCGKGKHIKIGDNERLRAVQKYARDFELDYQNY